MTTHEKYGIGVFILACGAVLFFSGYLLGKPGKAEIRALCEPYEAAAVEKAKAESLAEGIRVAREAVTEGNRLLDEYERSEKKIVTDAKAEIDGASDSPRVIDERLCRAACDAYVGIIALHPAAGSNSVPSAGQSADHGHD